MCEIKLRHWLGEGEAIIKEYKVLSFWYETNALWFLRLKPIRLNYGGEITDIDEPEILYAFPKKKEIGFGADKQPIYDELSPHKFLNKLRDLEVEKG